MILGSGYCEIDSNGCATDGTGPHGNNEVCSIRVDVAGTLFSTSFDTESDWDYITIGATRYEGSTGPNGVAVAAGSTFSWRSDNSNTNAGWTICHAGMCHLRFAAQLPRRFPVQLLQGVHAATIGVVRRNCGEFRATLGLWCGPLLP